MNSIKRTARIAGILSIVEIAFPLWLLIKGVDVAQWKERALESA